MDGVLQRLGDVHLFRCWRNRSLEQASASEGELAQVGTSAPKDSVRDVAASGANAARHSSTPRLQSFGDCGHLLGDNRFGGLLVKTERRSVQSSGANGRQHSQGVLGARVDEFPAKGSDRSGASGGMKWPGNEGGGVAGGARALRLAPRERRQRARADLRADQTCSAVPGSPQRQPHSEYQLL